MDKRYFTIFVMTNDASRAKQLKVPVRLAKTVAAFSAVFLIAMTFILFDYARSKSNSAELFSLKKENAAQRVELLGLSGKIQELEGQLAKLNLFDRKLRIIANIEAPKAAHPDQVMGIGGTSSEDEEGYLPSAGGKVMELVGRMKEELHSIEGAVARQETSFTELQEYLMKRSSSLAATPSVWPARGWVTSNYGERISPFTGESQIHMGMDIANRVGTPVLATAEGIVTNVTWDNGLGKMVAIRHGYGVKTTYGHLSEIFVRVGQRVKRGDKIAAMGNTGRSTGPHLHYEVSVNDVKVNPSKYILN